MRLNTLKNMVLIACCALVLSYLINGLATYTPNPGLLSYQPYQVDGYLLTTVQTRPVAVYPYLKGSRTTVMTGGLVVFRAPTVY
jgi:hypothetical protein